MPESSLSIDNLTVAFPPARRGGNELRVVQGVSLSVDRGETVGVVGESGSGKSMTALSVLRLLPEQGRITQGKIRLEDTDLLALTEKQMRGVRGGKIYGRWPGLNSEQLYEGRDLALTTDFRDVFGEIAARHLGSSNLQTVFPGYALNKSKFKGFLG